MCGRYGTLGLHGLVGAPNCMPHAVNVQRRLQTTESLQLAHRITEARRAPLERTIALFRSTH
ncbi:hypothetical protein XAXN_10760 [Xanthomonas axonopodis]|uniref:Uncharacterized protein n=1 Tax=Xanthomonas axonopodis TaxID=53413 RepID=A0A0P6VGB6_9XANT|nr:hypothetical protein XAXN_10760 [Xanthomonas axonopodis]